MEVQNPSKRYKSSSHLVYSCQYHVIFCPKYRRKVLIGSIETRLKELILEKQEEFEYEVVELITTGPKQMSMPAKYYFFPIQLNHIDRNPNLEQNINWGGNFNPEL